MGDVVYGYEYLKSPFGKDIIKKRMKDLSSISIK